MIVEKKEIAEKLKKLKGLLNNKSIGVNGVLVKSNTLYATNLEISIRIKLNIPESEEHFIIPRHAIELIENLPDSKVEITGKDSAVYIKCGSIKNKVKTYDVNDYAYIESETTSAAGSATIKSEVFVNALNAVLYAIPDESPKKEILKGILLEASGGELDVVGSDARRIAWHRVKHDGEFKVVAAKAAIKQILSLGITGDISIGWDHTHVNFKSGDYEIHSRIYAGEYLNYKPLFEGCGDCCVVYRKDLTECLKRTLICNTDKQDKTVILDFASDKVIVSLRANDAEYEEIIMLDTPIGTPLKIAFNGKYLFEAANSFDGDKLAVKLKGSASGAIIEDGNLSALVLPVRMN